MAFLIGPCFFTCLYSTCCIIGVLLQYFVPENLSSTELGPETLVGCPDGLCYLHMFTKNSHSQIINKTGHFPSIYILSTISMSYRKKTAKGNFKLIGDSLAHFDPYLFGESAWDMVDKLTIPLHLISKEIVKISSQTTSRLWIHWNQVSRMLGFCPHLQDLLLINPDYRLDVKGFLWDTGENTPSIVTSS